MLIPFHFFIVLVVHLVINGNLQQTYQLCAQKGRELGKMTIKQVFKTCIDKDFNQDFIKSEINKGVMSPSSPSSNTIRPTTSNTTMPSSNTTMPSSNTTMPTTNTTTPTTPPMAKPLYIIRTENMTLLEIMFKLSIKKINVNPSMHSIRELLILSRADDGYLMLKPISTILNATDPSRVANLTLQEALAEARHQNGFANDSMDLGLLAAWANRKDTMFAKMPIGQILRALTPMQIVHISISDLVNHLFFPYKRQVATMCGSIIMVNQTIEEITHCVPDKSIFDLLGYSKVKSFTVTEAKLLSNGTAQKTMNILQVLDLANHGFDVVIKKTAEPLILLARANNVSLYELKSQTLVMTLVKIFNVDTKIIRKVFSDIDNTTYMLVSTTPLQGLVSKDSGLKSVQELYTGSVQTMAATILVGKTSLEAIEKHLPRYVTMISGMSFQRLFHIYETSREELMDTSLVDIVHQFFGDFSANTFKLVYKVTGKELAKLKKLTYKQALNVLHDDPIKTGTLTHLIKYGAKVEDHKIGFLTSTLETLFAKGENITIKNLDGFNQSYVSGFKKLVPGKYKKNLTNAIIEFFIGSDLMKLRELIMKNMTEVKDLTITDLLKMTIKRKCETVIIKHFLRS